MTARKETASVMEIFCRWVKREYGGSGASSGWSSGPDPVSVSESVPVASGLGTASFVDLVSSMVFSVFSSSASAAVVDTLLKGWISSTARSSCPPFSSRSVSSTDDLETDEVKPPFSTSAMVKLI